MGGDAKGGRRVSLLEARELAQGILEELDLAGLTLRGEVAGSVRRGCKEVGDVDLVIAPHPSKMKELRDALTRYLKALSGDKILKGITESGIQVDVYLATVEDFGSQMFTWTGSKEFNVKVRGIAKRKGLTLSQYGVFRGGQCIASKSEDEMFQAVGIGPVSPELR